MSTKFRSSARQTARSYRQALALAAELKSYAEGQAARYIDGGTGVDVKRTAQHISQIRATLISLKAVPGIAAYAKAQVSDEDYDVVAAFNNMVDECTACVDLIVNMIPKDALGYDRLIKTNADATDDLRWLTGAQLAPVRDALWLVAATID